MAASILMEMLKVDQILNVDKDLQGHFYDLQDLSTGVDGRPRHNGPFVVFNWQESTNFSQTYAGMRNGLDKAPRVLQLWVHIPYRISTDYDEINSIFNRIDLLFKAIEHETGSDNQRVTTVRSAGRSAN